MVFEKVRYPRVITKIPSEVRKTLKSLFLLLFLSAEEEGRKDMGTKQESLQ